MYGFDKLKNAISQPHLVTIEANRLAHTRLHQRKYNPNDVDIFNQDWDTLIILDACRDDVFNDMIQEYEFSGRLESRISRGSATREWIRANFGERQLHDVVCLDSNGYYAQLKDVINAETHKYHLIENNAFGGISVHADSVTKAAMNSTGSTRTSV